MTLNLVGKTDMARFALIFNLIVWVSIWWFSLDGAPEITIQMVLPVLITVLGLIYLPRSPK